MKRIETMAELFAHLITNNSERPFNEIWEMYFRNYCKEFDIDKMNIYEVEKWLLQEVKNDSLGD